MALFNNDVLTAYYPMYTVPLHSLLNMRRMRPHQELLEDETLVEFKGQGKAIFVSHQWVTEHHPDPRAEQLKVLQGALKNLLSGAAAASLHPTVEFNYGRVKEYTGAELSAVQFYVWYDYFGCPQIHQIHRASTSQDLLLRSRSLSENPFEDLKSAIASIPYYVSRCDWFIALCPPLNHIKDGSTLDQDSWARRGWCMCEKMVRELSAHGSKRGLILMVESPKHLTVLPLWQSFLLTLGDGHFTYQQDLDVVAKLVKEMLTLRLDAFRACGDMHNYRFFLNQQYVRFRGCHIRLWQTSATEGQTALEAFYEDNGFRSVNERDEAGWSPLCYAAVMGAPLVVQALLDQRADPGDFIHKGKDEAGLPKRMPVVSLCAYFGNNQAMKRLLEAGANPNQRDGQFGAPLFWGNLSDNADGARILIRAGANPLLEGNPGGWLPRRNPPWNPIENAAAFGARAVMEEVFPQHGCFCHHLLHNALIIKGGSKDFISTLIKLGVDINEQFKVKKTWLVTNIILAQHQVRGPSRLTTLFYHRLGATPLMLAILSGSFGAAECLLSAGARVDLKNKRKRSPVRDASACLSASAAFIMFCLIRSSFSSLRSAFDFAIQMEAPTALCSALWERGGGNYATAKNIALWNERLASEVEVEAVEQEGTIATRMISDPFVLQMESVVDIELSHQLSPGTFNI